METKVKRKLVANFTTFYATIRIKSCETMCFSYYTFWRVNDFKPLLTDSNIEQNATEITLLTKQAIELYKASQLDSMYAKPILLYYSYIKLARVLFLSTYQLVEAKGNHRISLGDTECITIQRNGAFQRFHDSYSWDPSIYLDSCKFRWRDLINEMTGRYALVLNMSNCNAVYLSERKSENEQYLEHELTREIIFTYAMSMLARYKVQIWNDFRGSCKCGIALQNSELLYCHLLLDHTYWEIRTQSPNAKDCNCS